MSVVADFPFCEECKRLKRAIRQARSSSDTKYRIDAFKEHLLKEHGIIV